MPSDDRPVTSADEPFARPIMLAAMAVMIVATVAGNVAFGLPGRALPVSVLGAVYLVMTTVGWAWCERRGRGARHALLVALFALTLVILWASEQVLGLLVAPVLLLIVLYAGVRWAAAATVAVTGFIAILSARAGMTPLQVYLTSTDLVPGAILTIAFSHVLVRERRARAELRRYAAQAEELAATRERNRIARDIHDSVGHYLTVVNVQIEAARAILGGDPAGADECLVRAQGLARDGLAELRRSVSMLRAGPLAQRRFGGALAELIEETRRAGVDATLAVDGSPRALTPAIEFALYRAAQEALTNVVRHAHATRARCTLHYREHDVRLSIEDDGVGAAAAVGGFGLEGMRERVHAVGGAVDVRTAAGRGFAVDVRVPT